MRAITPEALMDELEKLGKVSLAAYDEYDQGKAKAIRQFVCQMEILDISSFSAPLVRRGKSALLVTLEVYVAVNEAILGLAQSCFDEMSAYLRNQAA